MASNINPNNIDGSYPVAGQDNNSQGFRDNFTNIKQNFQFAEDEINDLQSKAVLKAALTGSTLDNNMNDNLLYAARIQDFSATRAVIIPTGSPLTATVDYARGHYQTFSTTASTTLAFTNYPVAGTYGYLKVQINITDIDHTITIPASVSVGIAGIQGINPGTAGVSNTIAFGAPGYYEFGFGSVDGGTTYTIFDLNRALTDFIAADLEVEDVTATGFVSATGNVIGGNVITTGLISTAANVVAGNINVSGLISSSGNVVGGNIVTTGAVSTTGTLNALNINGFVFPSAGTTVSAPIRMTAGTLNSTATAGSLEFDTNVFYATPTSNQRGLLPSTFLRVQAANNTLADNTSAQNVFSSPAAVGLAASTAYEFEAVYYIARVAGGNSRTIAVLFALGGGGSLSSITYVAEASSTASNILGAVSRIRGTAVTATTVTGASTDTDQNVIITLRGTMKVNAAGTVTPQIQYSAAPGATSTLLPNSYIKFVPLGTSSVASIGNWS
jgi:hypothetical protein